MIRHYIYELKTNTGVVFYIGRTDNPERRKKEHMYKTNQGTEDKYVAMRLFKEAGIHWDLNVIAEVDSSEQPYEEYYMMVALEAGCQLTNMKMGDVEMCVNQNLKSYDEMKEFIVSQNVTARRTASKIKKISKGTGDSIFIDDLGDINKVESIGVTRIKSKRYKCDK